MTYNSLYGYISAYMPSFFELPSGKRLQFANLKITIFKFGKKTIFLWAYLKNSYATNYQRVCFIPIWDDETQPLVPVLPSHSLPSPILKRSGNNKKVAKYEWPILNEHITALGRNTVLHFRYRWLINRRTTMSYLTV